MKKLSSTEAELKKALLIKKKRGDNRKFWTTAKPIFSDKIKPT